MPQRMEAVDGDFLIPAGNRYGWFQTDPADHAEHVEVYKIVPDILTNGIGFIIARGDIRTDIISLQNLHQLRSNRNRYFLPVLNCFTHIRFEKKAQNSTLWHFLSFLPSEMVEVKKIQKQRTFEGGRFDEVFYGGFGNNAKTERQF